MSYEFDFDNVQYDDGFGVKDGHLVLECEPVFEDTRYTAHDETGMLATYGSSKALTGVNILGATVFLIGNNGVELGEAELDHDEVMKTYPWIEGELIDKLLMKDLSDWGGGFTNEI
jgi:hypothetical protein